MKKTLYLIIIGISIFVLCQCESPNLAIEVQDTEISFPKSSEKFGKSIASELENIVRQLHISGKNYSIYKKDNEIKEIYKIYILT